MQTPRPTHEPTSTVPMLPAARAVLATTRRAWLGPVEDGALRGIDPAAGARAVNEPFDGPTPAAPTASGARGDAIARHRHAAARLVSRVYRSASQPLRADMLVCLLRPLGTLSLVGVASGAFATLLQRHGAAPAILSVEEVARFSSEQIMELASFVHEVNPGVLEQLAALLAQNPMGVTAMSASALVLLYRRVRPAPATPSTDRRQARSVGPGV